MLKSCSEIDGPVHARNEDAVLYSTDIGNRAGYFEIHL